MISFPVRKAAQVLTTLALVFLISQTSFGYSVLTHQAIIDTVWEKSLEPLLLKRFPSATKEQLREAHAYAYGGAIIQDMGYYPFGSKFFTDLAHYVRSGDFVENLLDESEDLNEYAFALGALAHYMADNSGHPVAVNRAVPVAYPKLRREYGSEVTYENDPSAHIKVEFGFDVLQVAQGRYAPEAYHDFIGFKVSKPVLERAFKKTYGLEMKEVFTSVDIAIGSYRRAVSTLIPEATRIAWELKKDEIVKSNPGITREKFLYNLSRASYEKEWGDEYEKPGVFAKATAFVFRIMPKIGPFKAIAFKPPTPETEKMFMKSFNLTLERYRAALDSVKQGRLDLKNMDFDTGEPTRAGEYKLADDTYSELVRKLADNEFEGLTPELRENILSFFGNPSAPITTRKDKDDWQETLRALDKLKTAQIASQQ